MSGLDNLVSAIEGLRNKTLAVGFMANATYPDGTSVAFVAVNNEYGNQKQVPRPFMRRMVAKESKAWAGKMFRCLELTHYNPDHALDLMGEDMKGALQESIRDLQDPPLMPSTIAKKGFSKPLIDTSHMINSVAFEVRND